MIAELGNRIPVEVKENFKHVLDESIMIPSLSHYLKYVFQTLAGNSCSRFTASWMPGELAIILHLSIIFIVILTTPCRIEIDSFISMLS